MQKILLILHTIQHLKWIQIRFQFWYRLRRLWRKFIGFNYQLSIKKETYPLVFDQYINKLQSLDNDQFTFLNQSKFFLPNKIDWNYKEFGKLWTYNLNYFDFILQSENKPQTSLALIEDFISKLNTNFTGLEPYPIALRTINWIKFLNSNFNTKEGADINLSFINSSIYAQYQILLDNIEYHLLGNHLLEDGFSLLFGSFYFKDEILFNKANKLLKNELNEQIISDGAHFELSPMYHQILLDRLLDCINLVKNNDRFESQLELLTLMKIKAREMIEWLNYMTFKNGQIPLINDSTINIAPSTDQINRYALRLGILNYITLNDSRNNPFTSCLPQSGYVKFNDVNFECIVDIGNISPDYQPGHSHADTFNFLLNVNNLPVICDTGISTYNSSEIRLNERGTLSHNTVSIQNRNSSEVWSSFRVGRRAKVELISYKEHEIIAIHDGYQSIGIRHQRSFQFNKDSINIVDTLLGKPNTIGTFYLHFHPDVHFVQNHDSLILNNNICINFGNYLEISIEDYQFPRGFNKYTNSKKCSVTFKSIISCKISEYEN